MRGKALRRSLEAARRAGGLATRSMVRERSLLIRGLVATLGVGALEILRPWPLKTVFDFVLLDRDGSGAWGGIAAWMGSHPGPGVVAAGAALLTLALVQALLLYVQTILLATAAQRSVMALRARALRHLLTLSPLRRPEAGVGDLITRLTQDASGLRLLLSRVLVDVSANAVVAAGVALAMLWLDPALALVSLLLVPGFAVLVGRSAGEVRASVTRRRVQEGRTASRAEEVLSGMRAVQAFSREESEEDWFRSSSRTSLQEAIHARRLEIGLSQRIQAMSAFGVAVLVLLGSRRVLAGIMTPGDLIVLLAYGTALFRSVARIARLGPRLAAALAAGERLAEVFETKPDVRTRPAAVPAPAFAGRIEFRDVTFGYEKGRLVLRGLRFRVDPGEKVAIVGPTGGGKSTLLDLLLRFADPRSGQVLVDGRDIREFELPSYRRQFRTVFQDPCLLGRTVRENLAYARPSLPAGKVADVARTVGIAGFVETLPRGFDTRIGDRGASLSGGQRQGIAFARAMLGKGSITVLDEPTSGLDSISEARMNVAVRRLSRGRTTLVVAHRLSTVLDADRVLFLEDGRITAEGSHDELRVSCAAYRRLWDLQFGSAPGSAGGDGREEPRAVSGRHSARDAAEVQAGRHPAYGSRNR